MTKRRGIVNVVWPTPTICGSQVPTITDTQQGGSDAISTYLQVMHPVRTFGPLERVLGSARVDDDPDISLSLLRSPKQDFTFARTGRIATLALAIAGEFKCASVNVGFQLEYELHCVLHRLRQPLCTNDTALIIAHRHFDRLFLARR